MLSIKYAEIMILKDLALDLSTAITRKVAPLRNSGSGTQRKIVRETGIQDSQTHEGAQPFVSPRSVQTAPKIKVQAATSASNKLHRTPA